MKRFFVVKIINVLFIIAATSISLADNVTTNALFLHFANAITDNSSLTTGAVYLISEHKEPLDMAGVNQNGRALASVNPEIASQDYWTSVAYNIALKRSHYYSTFAETRLTSSIIWDYSPKYYNNESTKTLQSSVAKGAIDGFPVAVDVDWSTKNIVIRPVSVRTPSIHQAVKPSFLLTALSKQFISTGVPTTVTLNLQRTPNDSTELTIQFHGNNNSPPFTITSTTANNATFDLLEESFENSSGTLVRAISLSDYSLNPSLQKRFAKEIVEKISMVNDPNSLSYTRYLAIPAVSWDKPSLANRILLNNDDLYQAICGLVDEGFSVSSNMDQAEIPEKLKLFLPKE